MKKTVSMILVCALLVCTMLSLVSCGKVLNGKYSADLSVLGTYTYEFDMLGNVTLTVDPILGDNVISEGKYEINEDGDKITFTFENEDGEVDSKTVSFATVVENDVEYLKIDGVKYTKAD